MKTFEKYLKENITVGAFPIVVNNNYDLSFFDVAINMSDEWYNTIEAELNDIHNIKTYWFPMNECKKDIGLNSIFGAMCVLWANEKQNRNVLIHCHAGVNRSQATADAYYFMRTGKHRETNKNGYINQLLTMCSRGYLPPKSELEKFLVILWTKLTDEKIFSYGGVLDSIKLESINNF